MTQKLLNLVDSGRFIISQTDNDLTRKEFLLSNLDKGFREIVEQAFIFHNEDEIEALQKIALEQLKYCD